MSLYRKHKNMNHQYETITIISIYPVGDFSWYSRHIDHIQRILGIRHYCEQLSIKRWWQIWRHCPYSTWLAYTKLDTQPLFSQTPNHCTIHKHGKQQHLRTLRHSLSSLRRHFIHELARLICVARQCQDERLARWRLQVASERYVLSEVQQRRATDENVL